MHSALYEGAVRHRRFAVAEKSFSHRVAMAYVDLDELESLLGGALLRRGPALVRFRRSDYLGDPSVSLADAVWALVESNTGVPVARGPIRLLTQLRSFGHCFNPASFYYCFAPDGEQLEAVVAEVTNTPWGERHAYVLPCAGQARPVLRGEFDKRLHVSPFMAMDQRYSWSATAPGPTLSVHIESAEDGRRVFDATIGLRRRPFTRRGLIEVTARYPAATLRTLTLIYGHAVGLKLAGVPIHPHRPPRSADPARPTR